MHKYHTKIVLHNYRRNDGTRKLQLQSSINGELSRIPIDAFVNPSFFNKNKQVVTKGAYQDALNEVIETNKAKALNLFRTARFENRPLTKERFEQLMADHDLLGDFVAFMEKAISKEMEDKAEGTVKSYRKTLRLIKSFVGKTGKITYQDLDFSWLVRFDGFVRGQKVRSGKTKGKRLAHNTVMNHHKWVKKFINMAIDELDLNIKNPYRKFKISWLVGSREFLEPGELKKFVQLYDLRESLDLPKHLQESLRMFLFMVGSGFRISDTGKLEGLNIVNDSIRIRIQKTRRWKMEQYFPLSAFSKKYIGDFKEDGRIFRYVNSQQLNDNLKVICRYLNINKNITSHCARHTFATSFLIAGGKVEVLKELLGHSDIRTTMIYVHILKEVERKQIALLDAFLLFE